MYALDKILPKARKIDDEIADALQDLVNTYKTTTEDAPPHPFNIDKWRDYLKDHPDGKIMVQFIECGFPLGLKKDTKPKKLSKRVHNFINSKRDCLAQIKRIHKELQKKQIIPGKGHYQLNLLCVPKKDGATGLMTEIRVARHGSYAFAKFISINDAVSDEARKMKLPQFEEYVAQLYPYSFASLRDLKDAFRQLLLALEDREYIQYSIFALQFRDRCVAYGEAGAAACCQQFSTLIIWICENKLPEFQDKKDRMSVHVDDFLIVANSTTECAILTAAFDRLCKELGVKISVEKNEDSIQTGVVHGFGFRLAGDVKTVFIPADKAADIIYGCLVLLKTKKATGEALESLTGKIMHWSRLNRRVKVFCAHGIRLLHEEVRKLDKYEKPYVVFSVQETWLRDIALFLRYFLLIREVTMESILFEPSITIIAASDACVTGGGYVCANNWCSYLFDTAANIDGRTHAKMHINLKEAHAVLMLIYHNRRMLTGRKLWLLIDNQACMYGIIKAWSPSRALMDFVQEISLMLMHFCIDIRVDYIPSELNTLADLLSRGKRDQCIEWFDAFGWEANEIKGGEYYESLRIMHSSISVPKWLEDLKITLSASALPAGKAQFHPELLKFFANII